MRFSRRVLALFLILLPALSFADGDADIQWKTIETEHFVIYFYDDVQWTAQKVARVAEEIYPKVTEIYKHEPARKTRIVVRDDEDTSNGFAVFNLGFITVWASPSTLSLRGQHDWIRGVVTHEFAHVVSLQKSSGGGYLIEGLRFGGVANSDTEHNTDVGGSLYIPTNTYSRWWAEGTAQLDTSIVGYDLWDTRQDMLLRAATLENRLLTFDQMRNITVREYFGGEMVYNQGYAFLLWLRETYGQDANLKVARTAGETWNLNFDTNFEKALGKTAAQLYDEWKTVLKTKYEKQVEEVRKSGKDGERIPLLSEKEMQKGDPEDQPYNDGAFNFFPRFSPDGHWLSWVDRSTLRVRYLDQPFSVPTPDDSKSAEKTSKPAPLQLSFSGSTYAWSPDSRKIVLSRRKANLLGAYPYHDLYVVDLSRQLNLRTEYIANYSKTSDVEERKRFSQTYRSKKASIKIEPKRISHKLRATHVAWSPSGQTLAFSANLDGKRDLKLCNPDGSNVRDLVAIGGDAEALSPSWSPDGKRIVFSLFNHDQSDIWIVDIATKALTPLTFDSASDQDPVFTADGRDVIFSSDRTGIFQLYRVPAEGGLSSVPAPITQVETGAFMPSVAPNGTSVTYSRFSAIGFKPYRISLSGRPTYAGQAMPAELEAKKSRQTTSETVTGLGQVSSYFPWPRPVRIFPSFLFENDQFKAGMGLEIADYLEKHSLTGIALFGEDQDYQVGYTNNMLYPSFFATYTAYIRNNEFAFVSDGDAFADDPQGVVRDSIQFIDAGISQTLQADKGLSGNHTFSLAYDRRFVDRRLGFPAIINNELDTTFRLITNDGLTFRWNYYDRPSLVDRDFDINPRDTTSISLSYSLVHTSLFSPDGSIPLPNDRYYYHEGTVAAARTFSLPWTKPWWEHHSAWIRFNGGMKSRDVSGLDEFYLGGRINFRAFGQISSNTLFYGYEDFSISGETLLLLSTGYTVPIVRAIDKKMGFFYWDSVYASFFYEVGNAWSFGEHRNFRQNAKKDPSRGRGEVVLHDIGAEVRLKAFVFQDSNRWNSIVRAAYGFQDDARHGFSDSDSPLRFFVGIGTDF